MSKTDPFEVHKRRRWDPDPVEKAEGIWVYPGTDPQYSMPVESKALKARRIVLIYRWTGIALGLAILAAGATVFPVILQVIAFLVAGLVVVGSLFAIGVGIGKLFDIYSTNKSIYKHAKSGGVLEDE